MATLTIETSVAPLGAAPSTTGAMLAGGVDGYPAGTHGRVAGHRQGCLVFVPDGSAPVARWARRRSSLLVPPGLVVTLH
jgi:hypothetical protein